VCYLAFQAESSNFQPFSIVVSTRLINNILELEFTMKSQDDPNILEFHSNSLLNKFGILKGKIEIENISRLEGTFFRTDVFQKLSPGMKFAVVACTGILMMSVAFLTLLHRSGFIKYDLSVGGNSVLRSSEGRNVVVMGTMKESTVDDRIETLDKKSSNGVDKCLFDELSIGSRFLKMFSWSDRKKAYAVN